MGPIAPRLADALRSLAQSQLQLQASRSAALDGGAIGVMGIDTAVAATILAARSGQLPQAAVLVLLGLSAGLAGRGLFLEGAPHIGPSVVRILAGRVSYTDRVLDDSILSDLAADVEANRLAMARKARWLAGAFALLTLATVLTLAGGIH